MGKYDCPLEGGGFARCGSCKACHRVMDEFGPLRAQVAALEKDNDDIHELAEHYRVENARLRAQYNELLFAVVMKHPGETHHQTALRYIQQAENQDNPPSCAELGPLP